VLQFLSWQAYHCRTAISILACASLLRRNFYLGWRIIAVPPFCLGQRIIVVPPYPITASASSDCKPIFSSATPLCAIPASTKESSSCPLVTILLQANLLFSPAIVRRSANNPLTPSQRLTLRLPPLS
jgi:hypothetical protein